MLPLYVSTQKRGIRPHKASGLPGRSALPRPANGGSFLLSSITSPHLRHETQFPFADSQFGDVSLHVAAHLFASALQVGLLADVDVLPTVSDTSVVSFGQFPDRVLYGRRRAGSVSDASMSRLASASTLSLALPRSGGSGSAPSDSRAGSACMARILSSNSAMYSSGNSSVRNACVSVERCPLASFPSAPSRSAPRSFCAGGRAWQPAHAGVSPRRRWPRGYRHARLAGDVRDGVAQTDVHPVHALLRGLDGLGAHRHDVGLLADGRADRVEPLRWPERAADQSAAPHPRSTTARDVLPRGLEPRRKPFSPGRKDRGPHRPRPWR